MEILLHRQNCIHITHNASSTDDKVLQVRNVAKEKKQIAQQLCIIKYLDLYKHISVKETPTCLDKIYLRSLLIATGKENLGY